MTDPVWGEPRLTRAEWEATIDLDQVPDETIQAVADSLKPWASQDFSERAVRWSVAVEVVAAYLDAAVGGHLHTNDEVREIVAKARAEWEATIDYDEMAGWLQDTAENEGAISPDDVRIILAAAVSEDNE